MGRETVAYRAGAQGWGQGCVWGVWSSGPRFRFGARWPRPGRGGGAATRKATHTSTRTTSSIPHAPGVSRRVARLFAHLLPHASLLVRRGMLRPSVRTGTGRWPIAPLSQESLACSVCRGQATSSSARYCIYFFVWARSGCRGGCEVGIGEYSPSSMAGDRPVQSIFAPGSATPEAHESGVGARVCRG
jgi:hypothetical protein